MLSCTRWEFGIWSQCSVTCGRGIQQREARCIETYNADGIRLSNKEVDTNYCNLRERIVEKECIFPDCPSWNIGSWSACSVSCGDGFQTRSVTCADQNKRRLHNELCGKNEVRPAIHQTCNHGSCPQWRIRDWSKVF